jgi:hypothetical protein
MQVACVDGLGPNIRAVRRDRGVEPVQHHARLDHRDLPLRVDRDDAVAGLRPVDHHGGVAALARKAGPPAAGQHRRTVHAAHRDRLSTAATLRGTTTPIGTCR